MHTSQQYPQCKDIPEMTTPDHSLCMYRKVNHWQCMLAGTGISWEANSPQSCSHDSISLGQKQTTEQWNRKHTVQRCCVLEEISSPTQPHGDRVVHPVRCWSPQGNFPQTQDIDTTKKARIKLSKSPSPQTPNLKSNFNLQPLTTISCYIIIV